MKTLHLITLILLTTLAFFLYTTSNPFALIVGALLSACLLYGWFDFLNENL